LRLLPEEARANAGDGESRKEGQVALAALAWVQEQIKAAAYAKKMLFNSKQGGGGGAAAAAAAAPAPATASAAAAAPASAFAAAVEGPRFRFFSKASASVEEVAMLKQPLPSAPPPVEKKKKRPAEAASDELEATPPAEGAAKKKSAKPRQLAFGGEVETSA